jgi:hypothetical protein
VEMSAEYGINAKGIVPDAAGHILVAKAQI